MISCNLSFLENYKHTFKIQVPKFCSYSTFVFQFQEYPSALQDNWRRYLSAHVTCSSWSSLNRPLAAEQTRAGGGVNYTLLFHSLVFRPLRLGLTYLLSVRRNQNCNFSLPSKMHNSRLLGALHLGEKSSFFLPDQTAPFTIMDAVPINLYQLKGMDKLEPFPIGGRDSFASSWGRKKKKGGERELDSALVSIVTSSFFFRGSSNKQFENSLTKISNKSRMVYTAFQILMYFPTFLKWKLNKKQTTYRIIYLLNFNKILSLLIMYAKEKKTKPHHTTK